MSIDKRPDPLLAIPSWAEKELSKRTAFESAELHVLREFYRAWEVLHGMANDKLHRTKKEEAAQALVNHAHILRRMYAGVAETVAERMNG